MGQVLIEPTWESLLLAQAQVYGLTAQAQQRARELADWNQNRMQRLVKICLPDSQARE